MIMRKYYIILFLLVFSSCKRNFIPLDSTSITVMDFEIDEIDYEYLSSKSKFQYKNENQLINATLNTRIKKNEKIWFSIRVAFGIEGFRGLITKDEFKLIDRVNKRVIISTPKIIEKEFKVKLDFQQIESLLVGNLLYKISESDKILREGNVYKVVQQNQTIQTQNIVSAKTSKIEKLIVFDEFTNYLLTVDYDNFKPLGKLLFPVKHSYTSISYMDDTSVPVITNIIFNYNKVSRTNKALKFPFKIPSKYVVEKI